MANVEVVCGSCGASTPAPEDGSQVKCMYCGAQVHYEIKESSNDATNPQVENMLKLAKNAEESKNFEEAFNYYNRALEIDFENAKAWTGKGLAAVWQSSLANVRSSEMLPAFKNAIKNCSSDEEKAYQLTVIAEGAGAAYLALCNLAAGHWSEFGYEWSTGIGEHVPDKQAGAEFRGYINTFLGEYGDFYDWHSEEEAKLEEVTGKKLHLELPLDHYYLQMTDYVFGDVPIENLEHTQSAWCEIYHEYLWTEPANADALGDLAHPWSTRKHPADFDLYGMYVLAMLNREESRNYQDIPAELAEKYPIHDPRESVSTSKAGACFVASVCLVKDDFMELRTLRRFRDEVLLKRRWGRAFVSWYYDHGPALAAHVAKHSFLRSLARRWFIVPAARILKKILSTDV